MMDMPRPIFSLVRATLQVFNINMMEKKFLFQQMDSALLSRLSFMVKNQSKISSNLKIGDLLTINGKNHSKEETVHQLQKILNSNHRRRPPDDYKWINYDIVMTLND